MLRTFKNNFMTTFFFLWMGFNCLKANSHFEEAVYFLPFSSQKFSGAHFIDLRWLKGWVDLGATQMVLNTGPLDWESITLTTRPKFLKKYSQSRKILVKLQASYQLYGIKRTNSHTDFIQIYRRLRSSCWKVVYKKGDLKSLAKFTGKHLSWSLFLMLLAWGLKLYWKDSSTGFSC